jgi:hypothetical protein
LTELSAPIVTGRPAFISGQGKTKGTPENSRKRQRGSSGENGRFAAHVRGEALLVVEVLSRDAMPGLWRTDRGTRAGCESC